VHKNVSRQVSYGVFTTFAFLAALLTPNSIKISPNPIAEYRNSSGCAAAPRGNYGLVQLKAEFKAVSRPNDFAVIFATDRNFSLGTAITMDKYGNVFISLRSSYTTDSYKYAVLLSPPRPLNSKQVVEIDIHIDKRIAIKFDGKVVPLVDVNNGMAINFREMKTEINVMCIDRFGSKNFDGTSSVVLKQFERPLQIQLPLLRVMLLLSALGFALLAVRELSPNKIDLD
jgi:hypothetical protein